MKQDVNSVGPEPLIYTIKSMLYCYELNWYDDFVSSVYTPLA